MDSNIQVSLLIAIIGCFVGLGGWLSGRDKRISSDAEWKGAINAKLDIITGVKTDVADVKEDMTILSNRVTKIDESNKSAHKRIDELVNK